MTRINIFHNRTSLEIYINELLHVHIKRSEYLGMSAYKNVITGPFDANFVHGSKYTIEFILKGGSVVCEYDTREKWEDILKLLAEHL